MLNKFSTRNVVQCTVVGDGMVGKTCLSLAFAKASVPEDYVATVFENYAGKTEVNGDEYTISIFDSAGQHDYESLREFTYRESDVYVVCYSIEDRDSFNNIREFWVPEMTKNMQRKKPVILVATKSDLRNSAIGGSDIQVTTEEGAILSKEIGAVANLECSAHEINTVRNVFQDVAKAAHKSRKKKFSFVRKLLGK